MKRIPILLAAALALALAACGADQPTPSPTPAATPTVAPTPDATPPPTPAATDEPTDDGSTGGGDTGALSDLLPDRVGGLERVELPPGMENLFSGALAQQGIDAEEADFTWAQWGQGELMVTGLRAPGMTDADLDMLARILSSAQTGGEMEVESERATVGGKSVLRMTPVTGGAEATVYIYVAGDTMFTVVAESEDLAAELLTQLP